MDRLISLEPSNLVVIRIEQGQKCYGELTLCNVMHTMPVAFKLQSMNQTRYTIRPQSGIITHLSSIKIEIVYNLSSNMNLPESFPHCDDLFQLHSVVALGASTKGTNSSSNMFDLVPNEWFTNRRKQVFIYSGLKVMFVGPQILGQLVSNGCMDDIREVLEKSDPKWKSVDSIDENGQTLLHSAIAQSRPDLVQLLLEFGANVEAHGRSGSSPLEAAAEAGESLIAELLLAHKASPERAESSTKGPIHYAAQGGHLEILRLILLKGAQINAPTENGETALHLAVEKQKRDCVRLLLANGAKTDSQNSSDGETALHIASRLGDEHMVKVLLQKGGNKDVRNGSGKTAYDIAAENGYVNLLDPLGLGDSLCLAARKGEMRAIQQLIGNGVSLNGGDQNGWTALHRASFKGKTEAVKTLIENGIEINAKDEEGYTALHCAVEAGHGDVVAFLLEKGANLEEKTNKGVSAMQICESLGYLGIKNILVQGNKDILGIKFSFGDKMKGKDQVDIGEMQEKLIRRGSREGKRVYRGSYDQSMPLVVV